MNKGNFDQANEEMKAGRKVWRDGWSDGSVFLFIIAGGAWDFRSKQPGINEYDETLPFICVHTEDNCLVPWQPAEEDVFAEDWCSDRVY